MEQDKCYKVLANAIQARHNCLKSDPVNSIWLDRWEETIHVIQTEYLPSGSGINSGCRIDMDASSSNCIIINSSYHAMDENGYYDGWIDFTVKVRPHLLFDIDLLIAGRFGKYQDIREYLYDLFSSALTADIPKHLYEVEP